MEWTNEKYLQFIDDYRKARVLWDNRNPNYKNNSRKRSVVSELAQKYGVEEGAMKRKIKNLRSAFHREHHRLMNKKTGSDEETRKWFAYDSLKFILDVSRTPRTVKSNSNRQPTASENSKDSKSVRRPTTSENSKINEQPISFLDLSHDSPLNDQREKSSFSRDEPMHDTEDDQDYSDNPQLEQPSLTERPRPDNPLSKEEDEYDLFGRSMAMQLRKLPELTSLELMQKMQLMMLNARKQLSKENSRTKPKTVKPQASTSSAKRITPSPEPSSTASSPFYKIEVMSPSETDSSVNTDRNFTYVTTVEHGEYPSGQISDVTSNVSMDSLIEMKRKHSSVDPLEVQQNKHSF